MEHNEDCSNLYVAPVVEFVSVAVEHGYDTSISLGGWGDGGSEEGDAD